MQQNPIKEHHEKQQHTEVGKEKPSFMLFKIFLNVEKGSPIFLYSKIHWCVKCKV